jgi:hypothetical protein
MGLQRRMTKVFEKMNYKRRRTMKYMCLGYYDKSKFENLPESERIAMYDQCYEYDEYLRANGNSISGEALQGPETALTLHWKNGKVVTTDGPYAETKEQIGGLGILEARDMNHAQQLMAQHPALKFGTIWEIRPVGDMSEIKKASEQRRRAATMDKVISILVLVLSLSIGSLVPKVAAQSDKYPKMAPIEQYLMEKNAEIVLARSAAPDSISSEATILVLGRQGYETAVEGKNGFVCWVGRGWMGMFDWPEFWNPKVRAADCMNPEAARSILPIAELRAKMVMAGHSKAEIVSAVQAAFANQQLPKLESGAMDYMMSKSAYLTDEGDHNGPHLMWYTALTDSKDWGAYAAGSPVMAAPYWFISPQEPSQTKALPPILVFLVGVANWSDGTAAPMHPE